MRTTDKFSRTKYSLLIITACFLAMLACARSKAVVQTGNSDTAHKKQLVVDGFRKWAEGTGSVFDLLDENVTWTISGSAQLSKTYRSKQQLIDEVLAPLDQVTAFLDTIDFKEVFEK